LLLLSRSYQLREARQLRSRRMTEAEGYAGTCIRHAT
jgi:hypothetical protein